MESKLFSQEVKCSCWNTFSGRFRAFFSHALPYTATCYTVCIYLFVCLFQQKFPPSLIFIYCFFSYFLPSCFFAPFRSARSAHFLDCTMAFVDGLAFVQCSVNSMMVKITVKSYLNGSLIWIYRSNEIAHRLRIEAVEHITSKATHVSQNCAPNTQ